MNKLKWLIIFYVLLDSKGRLLGYGPNVQDACEHQLASKGSQLYWVKEEGGVQVRHHRMHCELVEPENVPMFGKWRPVFDD